MRLKALNALLVGVVFLGSAVVAADQTEDEIVRQYMQKYEKKHTQKLTFVSGSFDFNRINRDNDYNKFANYESNNFPGTDVSWLGDSYSLGMDFGIVFKQRFAWTLGGEYWFKMGEKLEGDQQYLPTGTVVENAETKIQVYGFTTGLQYYFFNHPQMSGELNGIALRVGAEAGLYHVQWDVWDEYSNLNLSTSAPTGNNISYTDNSPGISLNLGMDYPTNLFGMVLGIDMSALYLNFDQVAWYNNQEDEIIASYTGDSEGRVDLAFTGVRGRVELKKFFSW